MIYAYKTQDIASCKTLRWHDLHMSVNGRVISPYCKSLMNLVTFFSLPRIFSIRSVATDKLDRTAIYSKWTFILLIRNRLFVILNHIRCFNPSEYPVKAPHYMPVKHTAISPAVFAGIKSPAYPRHDRDTSKVKSRYFSPAIPGPQGDVVANDWCNTP